MLKMSLLGVYSKGAEVHGGGEILQMEYEPAYWTPYVDWDLCKVYKAAPYMFIGIVLVGLIIIALLYAKKRNIPLLGSYGISYSLARRKKGIRKRQSLINKLQFVKDWTKLVERSPFCCNKNNKDYMDYNIKRAGLHLPGNTPMYYEEYNALKLLAAIILLASTLLIALFMSMSVGVVLMVTVTVIVVVVPQSLIRMAVAAKDRIIQANFMDFYLILHYSLMMGSNTPLTKLMESYAKTTENETMHQFVAECVNTIDTYGEYNSTEIISRDFREIPQVGKLMRIIKQLFDGADVKQELKGFREEVIRDERYRIDKISNVKIMKVRSTIYVMFFFLLQCVLSAMAIYLPDIMGSTDMFSALG